MEAFVCVSMPLHQILSFSLMELDRFTHTVPPRWIKFWITKSPIIFLAISAITFLVGLNIFAFSSHQVGSSPLCYLLSHMSLYLTSHYKSQFVANTTIAFTAFHTIGLFTITFWFFSRLKWNTLLFQCIRRNILW